jgi:hypothetical protein
MSEPEYLVNALGVPVPKDLCPAHALIFRKWRAVHYDHRNPTEWPGGQHIMDSRTSHEERAAGWDRKTREQLEAVAATCRSGRSPQCTEPAP